MPRRIQEAGTAQALARRYRVQGGIPLSIDEVVVPVALVADLRPDLSNPDPAVGVDVMGFGQMPDPDPGQGGSVAVWNPPESGVTIHLQRADAYGPVDQELSTATAVEEPPGGGLALQAPRNTYLTPAQVVRGVVRAGASSAMIPGNFWRFMPAMTSGDPVPYGLVIIEPDILLRPGRGWGINGGNIDLWVNFWWTEVPIS